tara:strand:- start:735 stop:1040 length:306 start_codon:yes stop_codon:yes gene_type:complete
MIIVYITCADSKEAQKIGKDLLSKRLIACSNVFPIKSLYRWKGKLVNDKEYVLLGKTTENKFHNIIKVVNDLHSYDIPCIEKIKVKSNHAFAQWVKNEVKS